MSGNQSNTSENHCDFDNSLIITLVPPYILVISVLGIIFNVYVLMVFCLHKKACNVAEIYLSNLAGADLVLVCCLPFWAENVRKRYDWPFSESLCKVSSAVIYMNAFCSIYFLVLVSIDRYVALVHPLSHERIRRPFYAKLGCLFVWGLGLVFALPIFIYRKLEFKSQSNLTGCELDFNEHQYVAYEVITIIFSFIIPIIIISFCTVRIFQSLSNRLMEGLNTKKMEQKATTLILAVLLAFLICWVPFHVTKILDVLRYTRILKCNITQTIVQQVSVYFAFFNSVLNPILYVIAGKNFRRRAKELSKQWNNKTTETFSLMSTRMTTLRLTKSQAAL
ncbi:B2 bradykinin receptor-like isoform X1 [Oreochromis aureus]|uniref:B2 bradykinin receptor-like isoform X1 n=1 Tax=Oreochromis aureus TaxID=47969 RepID=UPI0012BC642A|nr:B2 bradykinin receptor-like isoform X1 [Oreochromis aureus]